MSKDKQLQPPVIKEITELGKLGCFRVQSLDIKFSNGQERIYYRLAAREAAVHILAIEGDNLILIREFGGGTLEYELGFVRGGVEPGENIIEAAKRELSEEAGYVAEKYTMLRTYYGSTSYQTVQKYYVVAEGLTIDPHPAIGDEPEPLEVVRWPISRLDELFNHDRFRDISNALGLYQLRDYLKQQGRIK